MGEQKELKSTTELKPVASPDGNGKKEAGKKAVELKKSSLENAFSQRGTSNVADQLVVPGDKPKDIAMRTILGKVTDGSVLAVAMSAEWDDLCEFCEDGDNELKENFLFHLAIRTSVNGEAREQLVKAIIGDNDFKKQKAGFGSVMEKAFGNKEEAKPQ
jgi:hypothetical protein